MTLEVESQVLEHRQVQLTVTVDDERLEKSMKSAARRIGKDVKIPGFRPGKAPYDVILRQVGKDVVFDEALDTIGQDVYVSALESAEVEPIAPGSLDEIVSREPLILQYTVPLEPEVELGNYRDIRLDYDEPEVDDEALEEVLEELRQGQALVEPVDRPAELSDVVSMDVRGFLIDPDEDDPSELLDEKGVSLLVDEKTDWPFPDVANELVGIAAGDERTVEYQFDEEYPNEALASRKASFDFVCVDVKSRLVPDWSDELAKNLGEFEDLLDLRIKIREQLEEQAQAETDAEYGRKVLDLVLEGASVDYPPILLESEIDSMVREFEVSLQRQNLALNDYLKIEDTSVEAMREEFAEPAEERLERGLVLGKLVEVEALKVDDEDVDHELDRMVASMGDQGDELRRALDTESTRGQIALDALSQKAMERLIAIAKDEAGPIDESPEEVEEESTDEVESENTKAESLDTSIDEEIEEKE